MITQNFLDLFASWFAAIVSTLPPLPAEWTQALGWITSGGNWLSSHLANLSPVVPWAVIYSVVLAWIGALTFWLAMLGLRLVLWMFGR